MRRSAPPDEGEEVEQVGSTERERCYKPPLCRCQRYQMWLRTGVSDHLYTLPGRVGGEGGGGQGREVVGGKESTTLRATLSCIAALIFPPLPPPLHGSTWKRVQTLG